MKLALASALVILCGAMPAFAQDEDDAGEVTYLEAREHRLSEPPVIYTGWRETPNLLRQASEARWLVRAIVGEDGRVVSASVLGGFESEQHTDEALAAASRVTFAPFEREGRRVQAAVDIDIRARPLDYLGPAERAFPANVNLSTVQIRLVRTACFGACPSYEVQIHGNGDVVYRGESDVLVTGEHRWRVPQANVEQIISLMREANYFTLEGHYIANVSDLPTYVTALDIGDQHKFVLNYGGSGMGGAVASTVMGSTAGPAMPAAVTEIERAIDRLSGVTSWVAGDENSLSALRAAGFDFGSQQGAQALAEAIGDCNLPLARALMTAGSRPDVTFNNGWYEGAAISLAPACGDIAFLSALIASGGLRPPGAADDLLWTSVRTGRPAFVRIALEHSRAVNMKRDGESLLAAAAGASHDEDADGGVSPFDGAEVVGLLLRAGARARDVNDDGENALFQAEDGARMRMLLAAGASPRARSNFSRETPLFGLIDADAARALIEAGVDPNAENYRNETALFDIYEGDVVGVLVAAGADVNHENEEVRTPIEVTSVEGVAEALLQSGARLPSDPVRLSHLIQKARRLDWEEVLPHLEARARSLGIQVEEQP